MAISEKVKGKIDDASQELKEAIDNLAAEVNELSEKVKEKLKGTSEDFKEGAEELKREVKGLSEKVRDLIPRRRKRERVRVRAEGHSELDLEPWDQPFRELKRLTDRLFDELLRSRLYRPWWLTQHGLARHGDLISWPQVDMTETDDAIQITAELPGVQKDDIDVSVTDDRVIIRGEKREMEEAKGKDYYRVERHYGSFRRSFFLPCEVEPEKAEATFKDGILRIVLPKSAVARERTRRIAISSE
ncbi:MAG: Hsp20 family protein [Deltaproteobacteria bacterium]|nr:Hsp20 family protein [Deltaproteobacteria bacterium]